MEDVLPLLGPLLRRRLRRSASELALAVRDRWRRAAVAQAEGSEARARGMREVRSVRCLPAPDSRTVGVKRLWGERGPFCIVVEHSRRAEVQER
eukprot:6250443-Alexandrium_andersonii.AAC.1